MKKMSVAEASKQFKKGEDLFLGSILHDRYFRMTSPSKNNSDALAVAVDDDWNDIKNNHTYHLGANEEVVLLPVPKRKKQRNRLLTFLNRVFKMLPLSHNR